MIRSRTLTAASRLLIGAADRVAELATQRDHPRPIGAGLRIFAVALQLTAVGPRLVVELLGPADDRRF